MARVSLLQNRRKYVQKVTKRDEEEKEPLNVSTWLVIWPNYLCLVAQSLACSIATHYACQLSAVCESTTLCVCVIQHSLVGSSGIIPPPPYTPQSLLSLFDVPQ